MSAELIGGLVAFLLALLGGAFSVRSLKSHGASEEKQRRAERDRDAAITEAENAARPPLTGGESVDVLRRVRNRGTNG